MSDHTPAPWGIEQTDTTNWIGPLRPDGKTAMLVCETDREGLRADALARNDADARRIVACVNVLEGLNIELIEEIAGIDHPIARLAAIATVTEEIGQRTLAAIIETQGDAAADAIIAAAGRALDRIKAAQPREHLDNDVAQPHESAAST